MKLETSIPARRDGTLTANTPDKTAYTFTQDAHGAMVCDVEDESHVAWLIDTGNFYPASDDDFERASLLMYGYADDSLLAKMTRAELVVWAEGNEIIVKANDTKAEIIAAIVAKRDAA